MGDVGGSLAEGKKGVRGGKVPHSTLTTVWGHTTAHFTFCFVTFVLISMKFLVMFKNDGRMDWESGMGGWIGKLDGLAGIREIISCLFRKR